MEDVHFPRVQRFRFQAVARTDIELPPFTGSMWRGLLGTGLRQAVCVPRQRTCAGCLITTDCAFFQLFELTAEDLPPDDPFARRYRTPSHPYVLDLLDDHDRLVAPGLVFGLGITLLGGADALLPYLIYALQRGGTLGLGRGRGQFRLTAVHAETGLGADAWFPVWQDGCAGLDLPHPAPVPIPPPPTRVLVELRTPLRIKRRGALVGAADLTAAEFLRHLCYRLDQLELLYGVAAEPCHWPRHRALIEALPAPDAPAGVRWLDQSRWSSRQAQTMKLGGLVGQLPLPPAVLPTLWPLLWLGQYVHLGKNTSFGLGQYRVLSDA